MAATDVALTDEHACRSCGHPKWMECPCGCCVADEEAAFAGCALWLKSAPDIPLWIEIGDGDD